MKKKLIITFSLLLISICSQSQDLSKKDIKEVSYKVAELIKSNYVLKEKGDTIAAGFLKDFKAGRFDFAVNWSQLDSAMSRSLKDLSNDGHLYTWHNLEIVHQLKTQIQEGHKGEGDDVQSFFNDKNAFDSNFGFQKVEIIEGNIGYLKLTKINLSGESLKTLYAAMEFIKNTRALIIDLRDNRGGGSNVGAVLETFFFENDTELLEFKSRNGSGEMSKTVPWLLEKRYTRPLFILINGNTASAAEAFTFALKHQKRAVVVGEPSAGGAFMNTYFPVNDEMVLAISSKAPFLPGTQFTWQGTGVKPDVPVNESEAKEKAIELIYKNLERE